MLSFHFSLSYLSERNHSIPEKLIWKYLVDLLMAVKHLHDHNLVHMDIKPENIFLDIENQSCKLGDFGLVVDISTVCTFNLITHAPSLIFLYFS